MSQNVIDSDTGREFWLFNSEELKADSEAYWQAKCEHVQVKLGKIIYPNGSAHVRNICLGCGEFIGNSIKKLPEHDSLEGIEYEAIRKRYRDQLQAGWSDILQKHVRMQRRRGAGFQKEYIAYLASPEWKKIREKVLKRANNLCEGCLERPASVVHHLGYKNIYREMMFDLVAVCRECHAICHPEKIEEDDDQVFMDDLPCYGCRHYAGTTDDGSWCGIFDKHTAVALLDPESCGLKRNGFEPLK